jgi:hypothetical protein
MEKIQNNFNVFLKMYEKKLRIFLKNNPKKWSKGTHVAPYSVLGLVYTS